MSNPISLEESTRRFRTNFPDFVAYSYITLLLWIFGIAVFMPLSSLVPGRPSLSSITALIFFIAIAFSGTRVLYAGKRALESYVDITAHRRRRGLNPKSIRLFGYIGIAILGGIVFAPIAWFINPVFGGITVVVVVLVTAFFILPLVSEQLATRKRAH